MKSEIKYWQCGEKKKSDMKFPADANGLMWSLNNPTFNLEALISWLVNSPPLHEIIIGI